MDIYSYLESKGVDYSRSGKNVSRGWVGINCVFCDDPSNHLGINLKSLAFNCFICHEKGTFTKLVKKIENCSFKKAIQTANQVREDTIGGGFLPVPATKKQLQQRASVLPKYFSKDFPPNYLSYLEKRKFDPQYLIKKYGLMAAPNYGPFRFRIIAPIFLNGKVISYVGRDVTGKNNLKYKMCPDDEALLPSDELLYNIDNCGRSIILVEGITDVWRFGDNTVALLKSTISAGQIKQILSKNIEQVIVILDADANKQAAVVADQLDGLIKEVLVLDLLTGDPERQSEKNIKLIKKYLQT